MVPPSPITDATADCLNKTVPSVSALLPVVFVGLAALPLPASGVPLLFPGASVDCLVVVAVLFLFFLLRPEGELAAVLFCSPPVSCL